jgi:hypothetical protein
VSLTVGGLTKELFSGHNWYLADVQRFIRPSRPGGRPFFFDAVGCQDGVAYHADRAGWLGVQWTSHANFLARDTKVAKKVANSSLAWVGRPILVLGWWTTGKHRRRARWSLFGASITSTSVMPFHVTGEDALEDILKRIYDVGVLPGTIR